MPSDPSGPRPHCARKWPLSTRQDENGEHPFPSGGPGRESPVPGGQGFGRQFSGAIASGGPGGHPGKPRYTLHPTNWPAPAPGVAPLVCVSGPRSPAPLERGTPFPGHPKGTGAPRLAGVCLVKWVTHFVWAPESCAPGSAPPKEAGLEALGVEGAAALVREHAVSERMDEYAEPGVQVPGRQQGEGGQWGSTSFPVK